MFRFRAMLGFLLAGATCLAGCGNPRGLEAQTTPLKAEPISQTPTDSPPVEWGKLKIRFLYDGDPPPRKQIEPTKDKKICSQQPLYEESLIVSPEGGIQNVVIWLEPAEGEKPPQAEKGLDASRPVTLFYRGCRIEPHVAFVHTGQKLILKNQDEVGHNARCLTYRNPPFNVIIPGKNGLTEGEKESVQQFESAERTPVPIMCGIHPWMNCWLIIKDHPHVGISNEQGQIEISNLPAGNWKFRAWHQESGYISEVIRAGRRQKWPKGKFEVAIDQAENELGEVKIAPALFQ